MFRDIINIFQITFAVCFAGFFLGMLYGAYRNYNMVIYSTYSFIVSLVSFFPLCFVIGLVYDSMNYGEFHYESASQIHDNRVTLPPAATAIIIHKFYSCHNMKFYISKAQLDAWYNSFDAEFYTYKPKPPVLREGNNIWEYDKFGWKKPARLLFYEGPKAANGGGFDIYYDEPNETAYLDAGYW